MRKIPWHWIIPLVLIVALAWTARAYAGALGRADAAASESERIDSILRVREATTAQLTQDLARADSGRAAQRRADSVRVAQLERQNRRLSISFDSLVAADETTAQEIEAAVAAFLPQIEERHQAGFRLVTRAYNTQITGLRSQIAVVLEQVEVVTEERDIARADANREREGRRASDVLVVGLRDQIGVLELTVGSRDVEIRELRNAVAPGFFMRIFQNAELVAITAGVSAGLTYVLTR